MGKKRKTVSRPRGTATQKGRLQRYDFGNCPLLLSLPYEFEAPPVQGCLTGTWSTLLISADEFVVVDVAAMMVLPSITLKLPGQRAAARINPGAIPVKLARVTVPEHLRSQFPYINRGSAHPARYVRTTMGLEASFSAAQDKRLGPVPVILESSGYVQKDGSINAVGVGHIVGGWLAGGFLACCSPKPPVLPGGGTGGGSGGTGGGTGSGSGTTGCTVVLHIEDKSKQDMTTGIIPINLDLYGWPDYTCPPGTTCPAASVVMTRLEYLPGPTNLMDATIAGILGLTIDADGVAGYLGPHGVLKIGMLDGHKIEADFELRDSAGTLIDKITHKITLNN